MTHLFKQRLQLLVVVLLTITAYANIFQNQFVWDDQFFIQDWSAIRSWESLPEMLQGQLPPRFLGAFRPGLSVSYLLLYQLFGQNSWDWHLQALVVHLICTVLVFLIVEQLVLKFKLNLKLLPFLTALFFGVHPIHTEAVTYIASSINTIGIAFFLAAFYLYLRKKSLLSLVFAGLAFFTYELTLTLPVLVIFTDLLVLKISPSKIISLLRKKLLIYGGLIALVLIYLLARVVSIQTIGRGDYPLDSFYLTMLTMAKVLLKYLQLLVLPVNQSINHVLPGGIVSGYYLDLKTEAIAAQHFLSIYTVSAVVILGLLFILAFRLRRKYPIITFSIGWLLLSLLPASNLMPVQEFMAERYLYIPSVGFCLLLAYLILNLNFVVSKQPSKTFNERLKIIAVLLLATSYLVLTFLRNTVWYDALSLWLDTAKKTPQSEIAYYNLGNAYLRKNQKELAVNSYLQAIKNKPKSMGSYINLGNTYMSLGRLELAKNAYTNALAIDPNSPTNYNNLGVVLTQQGHFQEALENFLKALRLDPSHLNAKQNMEILLEQHSKLNIEQTLKNLNQ